MIKHDLVEETLGDHEDALNTRSQSWWGQTTIIWQYCGKIETSRVSLKMKWYNGQIRLDTEFENWHWKKNLYCFDHQIFQDSIEQYRKHEKLEERECSTGSGLYACNRVNSAKVAPKPTGKFKLYCMLDHLLNSLMICCGIETQNSELLIKCTQSCS